MFVLLITNDCNDGYVYVDMATEDRYLLIGMTMNVVALSINVVHVFEMLCIC